MRQLTQMMRQYVFKLYIFPNHYPPEPPHTPPILSLEGERFTDTARDNNITVVEGHVQNIGCQVNGGFPEAENITVVCAELPVENDTFIFTRDHEFSNCTCNADHESGCYDLETEVFVYVLCELYL